MRGARLAGQVLRRAFSDLDSNLRAMVLVGPGSGRFGRAEQAVSRPVNLHEPRRFPQCNAAATTTLLAKIRPITASNDPVHPTAAQQSAAWDPMMQTLKDAALALAVGWSIVAPNRMGA